ncbi:unnamed protein product [Arabidopsis halleri]
MEEENPNSMYLSAHLLEELFLKLPLKSLGRFKSVSKEWKSILESKWFVDRHLILAKSCQKILLAYDCECGVSPSLLPGVEDCEYGQEFVYLHCDATRPFMSYEGLVCFPEAEWVNVLNPSTGQLRRFHCPSLLNPRPNSTTFREEEFHDVPRPPLPKGIMFEAQIANIEDRLVIAMPVSHPLHQYELEIWSMDGQEETWSKTHSISLASLGIEESRSFTPVTLSKQGDVLFYDDEDLLFKYISKTDELQTLPEDMWVISPYVENLVPLPAQQVELRTGITCLHPLEIEPMDGIQPRSVDEFLRKGMRGQRIFQISRNSAMEEQNPHACLFPAWHAASAYLAATC